MACVELRLVWLLVGVLRILVFTLGDMGSHGKFLSCVTTSSGFHLKSISLAALLRAGRGEEAGSSRSSWQ